MSTPVADATKPTSKSVPATPVKSATPTATAPILEHFRCPISKSIFLEPVVASDGHTYERTELETWFKNIRPVRSPMTNLPLASDRTCPNIAVKQYLDEWFSTNAHTLDERYARDMSYLVNCHAIGEAIRDKHWTDLCRYTTFDVVKMIGNNHLVPLLRECRDQTTLSHVIANVVEGTRDNVYGVRPHGTSSPGEAWNLMAFTMHANNLIALQCLVDEHEAPIKSRYFNVACRWASFSLIEYVANHTTSWITLSNGRDFSIFLNLNTKVSSDERVHIRRMVYTRMGLLTANGTIVEVEDDAKDAADDTKGVDAKDDVDAAGANVGSASEWRRFARRERAQLIRERTQLDDDRATLKTRTTALEQTHKRAQAMAVQEMQRITTRVETNLTRAHVAEDKYAALRNVCTPDQLETFDTGGGDDDEDDKDDKDDKNYKNDKNTGKGKGKAKFADEQIKRFRNTRKMEKQARGRAAIAEEECAKLRTIVHNLQYEASKRTRE
jgi:hypothetical protein